MTTIAQIRKGALALPEVTEGTRFGMVAFKVRDKGFASITKDGALQVQLDPAEIDEVVGDVSGAEPLLRMGTPIGVRVALEDINGMQSNALLRRAWLARAPKRLAASMLAAQQAEPGDLPTSIGRPATRALVGAGISSLAAVAERSESEVAALHGVGPRAVQILAEALQAEGLEFADET